MSLTPRQARFAEEYLIDLNAKDAAIRAGYCRKNAKQLGHKTLQAPAVQEAVTAAVEARSKRTEITADMVLRRLVENVERSMRIEAVRDRDGNETGEYVYEGAVANRALELLGKHLQLFNATVKHEHEHSPTVTRVSAEEVAAEVEEMFNAAPRLPAPLVPTKG